jgi:hypothetical protein
MLLYGINLLTAILLTIPFRALMQSFFGDSLMTEKILQGFDYDAFVDFMKESHSGFEAIWASILWFGLFYLVFNAFLAGGILGVFQEKEKRSTFQRFFAYCATYFGRFLRLLMFSVVFFLVVIALNAALSALVSAITENAQTEVPSVIWKLVQYLVVFLLLCFVNMIFDYAKIQTVVEGNRKMVRTTLGAIRFIFRHPGKSLGLFYFLVFIAILISVIYLLLELPVDTTTPLGVFVLFILQQIFMILRVSVRTLFFSSQFACFQNLVPVSQVSLNLNEAQDPFSPDGAK